MAGLLPVCITNYTPVGGIFKHIEYKMEMNLEGAYWEVYRRYSEFATLNKKIRLALGDIWCKENDFKPTLPGKEIPHQLNGDVIDKRIPLLNEFMADMIGFTPPEDKKNAVKELLRTFLDMDNRGKSGIRRSLDVHHSKGGDLITVVRESFALVSRPKTFNMIYQSCFIALTTQKVLYICSKVYDRAQEAKHTLPLDHGLYRVKAVSKTRFDLVSPDNRFNFSFVNENDAAHWMRAVGDATIQQTMERSTEVSRRESQQKQQAEHDAAEQKALNARPQQHEFHGSTGGTVDNLSAQFGV